MKNFNLLGLLTLLFCFANTQHSHAQFRISSGATVTMSGNAQIVCRNLSFENNGNFIAGTGTVVLLESGGSNYSSIGGSGTTSFNHLNVNMASKDLRLLSNITVNGNVVFTNGHFDLNGFELLLGTANGQIVGESESSSFIGAAGGEIVKKLDLNAPASANPGNLGAIITSSQNLGFTIIQRGHKPITNGSNTSINRYFDISPTNNSNLNATLRFQYLDAERNNIPESELTLWRNDGSGWQNMGFSSRNGTNNFVELNGIASLSSWTATNQANPLIMPEPGSELSTRVAPVIRSSQRDLQPGNADEKPLSTVDGLTFKLYPNPTSGNAALAFELPTAQSAMLRVFDMQGRMVLSQEVLGKARENILLMDLEGFAAGTYLIDFRSDDLKVQQRLMVQE